MSFSYDGPNLRIYDSVLDQVLNSPGGEVGRYMRRKGKVIRAEAKRLAGRRTGALARSIYLTQSRDSRGQLFRVGSPLSYAFLVHEGTRPHEIIGKPGRQLRFIEHGRVVYAHSVSHPGTRGKHYLTIPMRANIK